MRCWYLHVNDPNLDSQDRLGYFTIELAMAGEKRVGSAPAPARDCCEPEQGERRERAGRA